MRFHANDFQRLRLELEREFDALNNPQAPKPVFHCTTANRPAASAYPFCVIFNETTATLQVSDGTNWV